MKSQWSVRNIFCALYVWSAAVFFGAVLIDVVYSALLGDARGSVYGEVSDFLLLLGAPTALAALAALALSGNAPSSRTLFALSLLLLSLEFLAPIVLFPILRTSANLPAPAIGPYVRLVPLGLASLLALAAFRALFREPPQTSL